MKDPYKFGKTLLITAGVAGVLGLIMFFVEIITGVLLLIIAASLGFSGYSVLKRYAEAVKAQQELEEIKRKTAEEIEQDEDEAPDGISLPSELDLNGRHYALRYSYDHVDVACPSSQDYASVGDWVSLELEPDNQYDDRAVRLVLDNGHLLGYLYKGKLQDMANDFLRRHLPVTGLVEDDSASSILLGFYKED